MRRAAFTLVELIAVMVIVGILAIVVAPRFIDSSERAKVAAISSNLKMIRRALIEYKAVHGAYPPDQNGGIMPPEMAQFIPNDIWAQAITGIGVYNWEGPPGWANHEGIGVGSLVSTPTSPTTDAFWAKIDAAIDDGALTTGYFRWESGAGRYEFFLGD